MALKLSGSQRSRICRLRTLPAAADPGATTARASRDSATTPVLRAAGPNEEDRLEPMLAPLDEGERPPRRSTLVRADPDLGGTRLQGVSPTLRSRRLRSS